MLKIGITGGIGSGKTYVCQILEKMGYPVFYSDIEAKKLMQNDPKVKYEVKKILGENAYTNHEINRAYISKKIFNNEILRSQLNAIVHPAVYTSFDNWAERQLNKLVFNESALLFETGSYQKFDKIILVTCSSEAKKQRLKLRDQLDDNEINKRMEAQLDDVEKMKLSDFIINNDQQDTLLPQLIKIITLLNQ